MYKQRYYFGQNLKVVSDLMEENWGFSVREDSQQVALEQLGEFTTELRSKDVTLKGS